MQYAPIALFTYNRAAHTRQAVESLLQNEEARGSDLYIFSDGPKTPKKAEGVRLNREYIHTVKGFKSVTIIEREKNWGLANSLIAGITELTGKFGRVIVVEDDLVVSPYFLKFMNDGLNKYQDDNRVSAISAFLNPINSKAPETFFLRYFACWGWATWKRAWDLLNTDAKELLRQMRWKKDNFNIGGTGPFYGHLYCHKVGLVDSWAVRFYASSFLADKLVLFPGHTMAIQSGMDGSGIHSGICDTFSNMELSDSPISVGDIPVAENREMYDAFSNFYGQEVNRRSARYQYGRIKSFIRRLLNIDCR